jgi:hypothetical protein
MTDGARNGHDPGGTTGALPPDDDLDDDAPLDEAEAAAGAAAAGAAADESLDERVGAVCDELGDVTRTPEGERELLAVGGRSFAALGVDSLDVALDGPVAKAALTTPDTRPSPRGAGWVTFTPAARDRFALDRAEAWVRLAHRRAGGRAS